MTVEEFLKANAGLGPGGSDLPAEIISDLHHEVIFNGDLYASAKSTSVKPGPVGVRSLLTNPTKEGWMRQQQGKKGGWSRVYWMIADGVLFGFSNEEQPTPDTAIPLGNIFMQKTKGHQKQINMYPNGGEPIQVYHLHHAEDEDPMSSAQVISFKAAALNDAEDWLRKITAEAATSSG